MTIAQSSARFGWWGTLSRAMMRNATKAKTSVPPASPSSPSVMFTPLLAAMIAKAAKGCTAHEPISTSPTNGTRIASIAKWCWMYTAASVRATTICQASFWRTLMPIPVLAFR